MVGILRCGKMLPPQLNLVIEIEFADATTALWSENAGAHPAGATLSTDFEIQNVRVLASQVVLDSALVESFNRVLLSGRSLVFSYPTVHTQQSSVPNGVAEHNVTVARAFTGRVCDFLGQRRGLQDPLAGQRHAGHPGRGAAGAHAHHAWKFSGALQQPELRGLGQLHGGRLPAGRLRHDPERLRLEHCAHLHANAGSAAGTGWARPPTW